jgi:hypothetical protein
MERTPPAHLKRHGMVRQAVGVDGVGALVGRDAAETDSVFAAGQFDLHLVEHHPRRLLALMLGVDGLPAAFEFVSHGSVLLGFRCRQ